MVNITDSPIGGIEGNPTVDHLITLKQAIQEVRKAKNGMHHIPGCSKSVYDKAWLDAILYVLEKNRVKEKNLADYMDNEL